jgi:hypothetical protein
MEATSSGLAIADIALSRRGAPLASFDHRDAIPSRAWQLFRDSNYLSNAYLKVECASADVSGSVRILPHMVNHM